MIRKSFLLRNVLPMSMSLALPADIWHPGKVITEFPTTDEALTPGLAMYMKNVFAKNQVDVAVLGCYLNLANPNPEQLAKITHRYMAHIRFASWLGCGVVGTETGAPNETYTAVPECHGEEALQTFITNLRPGSKIRRGDGRCHGHRAGMEAHCLQPGQSQKSAG